MTNADTHDPKNGRFTLDREEVIKTLEEIHDDEGIMCDSREAMWFAIQKIRALASLPVVPQQGEADAATACRKVLEEGSEG